MSPPVEILRVVEVLPDAFAWAETGRGRCIEAARLLTVVSQRLSIPVRPLACDVTVMNLAAVTAADQDLPMLEWPADAALLYASCDGENPSTASLTEPYRHSAFPGHLVVAGLGWFLDATAPQFSRPDHQIDIGGAISGPYQPDEPSTAVVLDNGVAVSWRWRPEIKSWRNTPAWRQDIPGHLLELLEAVARDETGTVAAGLERRTR